MHKLLLAWIASRAIPLEVVVVGLVTASVLALALLGCIGATWHGPILAVEHPCTADAAALTSVVEAIAQQLQAAGRPDWSKHPEKQQQQVLALRSLCKHSRLTGRVVAAMPDARDRMAEWAAWGKASDQ